MSSGFISQWVRRGTVLAFAVLLLAPVSARAATLTFQPPTTGPDSPNQSDLENLDHLYMYAWRITGLNTFITSSSNISSVTLTISNITNWDSNPNHLFMHLLDTTKTSATNASLTQIGNDAVTGGTDNGKLNTGSGTTQVTSAATAGASQVYKYQDNPGDNVMMDDFATDDNGSIAGSLWHTSAGSQFLGTGYGVGNIALGNDEDLGETSTNAASGWVDHGNGVVLYEGWADENTAGGFGADGRNAGTTASNVAPYSTFMSFDQASNSYTYSFSAAEILKLRDFITMANPGGSGINAGTYGDIAIALDPDCHFFNDNITLAINYTNGSTNPLGGAGAMPEPATLTLLGTALVGLAGLSRRRNRKNKKSVA